MGPCKNEMSAMETRFAIVRELLNNGRFNDEDDLLKKADKVTRWILGQDRSRMDEEHAQLEERIGRLSEFICSDEYEDLPKEEKGDLAQQYKTMRKYAEVLSRRILRAQEVQ